MKILRRPSFSIEIKPSFLLLALIFGFIIGATIGAACLMGAMLLAVFFIHELGHVIVCRLFRRPCAMTISAIGGTTEVLGPPLRLLSRCAITFGGLVSTYISFITLNFLMMRVQGSNPPFGEMLYLTLMVTGAWFWINVFPFFPFDGGKLVVDCLGTWMGRFGEKLAAILSMILALIATLYCLKAGMFTGIIFTFYTISESWGIFRRPAFCRASGQLSEDELLLHDLQERWLKGEQEPVVTSLKQLALTSREKEVRQQSLEWAGEYLLLLERPRDAYELLTTAKDPLLPPALEHLALAAYRTSHWLEGLEACRAAFTARQTRSIAMLAAMLSARLALESEAIEWINAASALGLANIPDFAAASDFDALRGSPAFQSLALTSHENLEGKGASG